MNTAYHETIFRDPDESSAVLDSRLMIGKDVGAYHVLARLGSGGMGQVYEAFHRTTGRRVALKLLNAFVDTPEGLARFGREMRMASRVTHPNLVKLYDGDPEGDPPFIAMELLIGESLDALLAGGRVLEWRTAVSIARDIACSMVVLHQLDIIHRDLKPSNVIIVAGGEAKVIDFGLARDVESTLITVPGLLLGTLIYVPPEVLTHDPVTTAVDMWGLGCILYQMLCGQLHIDTRDPQKVRAAILNEAVRDPRVHNPEIAPELAMLTCRLLDRSPLARPNSSQVVALLQRLLDDGPASAIPLVGNATVALEPARRPWKRVSSIYLSILLLSSSILTLRFEAPQPASRAPAVASPLVTHRSAMRSCFGEWRTVEPRLHLIKERHLDSSRHSALRGTCAMDLGADAFLWIYWVRLGRWFASRDRPLTPPRCIGARVGPLIPADTRANRSVYELQDLDNLQRATIGALGSFSPDIRMKTALAFTADRPDDPRGWLLLGLFLDQEGDEAAPLACRRGLELLKPDQLCGWADWLWMAYARALVVVPGYDLEHRWIDALRACPDDEKAFGRLDGVVDGARLKRLLEQSAQVVPHRAAALEKLGDLLYAQGQMAPALEVWMALLRGAPDRAGVGVKVTGLLLSAGDLEQARRCFTAMRSNADARTLLTCCDEPSDRPLPALDSRPIEEFDGHLHHLQIQHLLELKQLEPATTMALETIDLVERRQPGDWHPAAIDVIGCGSNDRRIVDYVERWLLRTPSEDGTLTARWVRAAGAMIGPAAVPRMTAWLAAAELAVPRKILDSPMIRSAWLSRRGLLRESLAALPWKEPCPADPVACEILCRAVFKEMLGHSQPGTASAAAAVELFVRYDTEYSREIVNFWSLVKASNRDGIRAASAALHQKYPREPLWYLTLAWSLAGTRDRAALNGAVRRMKVQARYHALGMWLIDELVAIERDHTEHEPRGRKPRG